LFGDGEMWTIDMYTCVCFHIKWHIANVNIWMSVS